MIGLGCENAGSLVEDTLIGDQWSRAMIGRNAYILEYVGPKEETIGVRVRAEARSKTSSHGCRRETG